MKLRTAVVKLMLFMTLPFTTLAIAPTVHAEERPACLEEWRSQGRFSEIDGHKIFVHASGPKSDEGVLIVHGYPGSSWDWSGVVGPVGKKTRVVVIDMLGFGQSDKPLDGKFKDYYSLMKQADLYEAVAKEEGLKKVVLVAHDMGQTVGTELMARQDEGKLPFRIKHAIILNGSTLVDMVKLAEMQKQLLKLPDQASKKDLSKEYFVKGLRPTFDKNFEPIEKTLNCMAMQILENDGDKVIGQILRYLDERKEFYDRWVGTLTGFQSAPMTILWGRSDPVAHEAMADRIKLWRPVTDLYKLESVGHWPSIEVPNRVAKEIINKLDAE